MNKYTPIHTHAQLVEALRRGLTVEINTKDNESAADYQAPQPCGWVSGLPAVTIAADDPNSHAWQGFTFRAVGEHDLSPDIIHTRGNAMTETQHAALVLAVERHIASIMHLTSQHDPATGQTVTIVDARLVRRHAALANYALQEIKGRVPAGHYARAAEFDTHLHGAPLCAAT